MSITAEEARKNVDNISREKEILYDINSIIEYRSKEGLTKYRYAFSGDVDDWKIRKSVTDDLEERGFYVKYTFISIYSSTFPLFNYIITHTIK